MAKYWLFRRTVFVRSTRRVQLRRHGGGVLLLSLGFYSRRTQLDPRASRVSSDTVGSAGASYCREIYNAARLAP